MNSELFGQAFRMKPLLPLFDQKDLHKKLGIKTNLKPLIKLLEQNNFTILRNKDYVVAKTTLAQLSKHPGVLRYTLNIDINRLKSNDVFELIDLQN